MKRSLHVYYSGRVQGIGFRFTAQRIAEGLRIGGWVSNLADGRVEINAEGSEDSLKEFIAQINGTFKSHIQDIRDEWGPAQGEFKGFNIR